MIPISVVLPVYIRTDVSQFRLSFGSLLEQTVLPQQVIVVADGPITEELREAIEACELKAEQTLTKLYLPKNNGVAAAMRAGMVAAKHRWIARQDSDDISLPERFERTFVEIETGEYAAVGGAMLEFDEDPQHTVRERTMPTDPLAAARYTRWNSPMNNPTVTFDAEAVTEVGGLRDLHLMEDYDLFARLVSAGYKLKNVPEPLVLFRAGEGMFDRRTGQEMSRAERQMQRNLVRYGLISRPRAVANYVLRQGFRSLPRPMLKRIYKLLFDRRR